MKALMTVAALALLAVCPSIASASSTATPEDVALMRTLALNDELLYDSYTTFQIINAAVSTVQDGHRYGVGTVDADNVDGRHEQWLVIAEIYDASHGKLIEDNAADVNACKYTRADGLWDIVRDDLMQDDLCAVGFPAKVSGGDWRRMAKIDARAMASTVATLKAITHCKNPDTLGELANCVNRPIRRIYDVRMRAGLDALADTIGGTSWAACQQDMLDRQKLYRAHKSYMDSIPGDVRSGDIGGVRIDLRHVRNFRALKKNWRLTKTDCRH